MFPNACRCVAKAAFEKGIDFVSSGVAVNNLGLRTIATSTHYEPKLGLSSIWIILNALVIVITANDAFAHYREHSLLGAVHYALSGGSFGLTPFGDNRALELPLVDITVVGLLSSVTILGVLLGEAVCYFS